MNNPIKNTALLGGATLVYAGLLAVGVLFSNHGYGAPLSLFWPGNGFLLAVMLRIPVRLRIMLLGSCGLTLLGINLGNGKAFAPSLGLSLANLVEVAVACKWIQSLAGGAAFLGNLKGTLHFFGMVCLLSAAAGGLLGAATTVLFSGGSFPWLWGNWTLVDAAGLAVITPVMLAWWHPEFAWEGKARLHAEFAACVSLALGLAYVIFARPPAIWNALGQPLPYLSIPFMMWAALRFGPRGATTVLMGVYAITAWFTGLGQGPFIIEGGTGNGFLVSMHLFPYAVAFCSLVPAVLIRSQMRAEAMLRVREKRYGDLWNSKLIGIYVTDLNGGVVEANETFLSMLKRTREDLEGGRIEVLKMTRNMEQAKDNIVKFRSEGQIGPFEKDWVLADGNVFSTLTYASMMDEPDRALGMVMDMGALKQAKQELHRHESRYRDLLSSSLIGIFVSDFGGLITEANDTFLAMIRRTRGELEAGQIHANSMATPEYVKGAQARREQFQATGQMGPIDREWQLQDGSRLNTLFFATKTEEADSALCMVLDTTELKRTQAELRVMESRFKNMFDSNIVGLAIMNKKRVFEEANDVYLGLAGYSREELEAGLFSAESLLVPELKQHYQKMEEFFQKQGKILPEETLYMRRDGTRVPVFRGIASVDDAERYLILAIDLSAEKATQAALGAAKQEAVSANQAKSEFLAHMSHEIRTPLNGVLGMLSLLLDTKLSPEQQSYARASRESGEHLLALINQVLDFSKIGSGHLELDVSEFALESIVESAYTSVLETAQKKGMEIVSRPDPDLPGRVLGDPVRLQQVLMNLIGNAVKFSDRGEVCINSKLLSRGSGQCEILFEITDQGPGLSVASRERLFQPFRQGDASLSRKVGGTGLGLAISKELVERMGGRIWAENRIPRGSSFRFTVRLGESSGFPLPAYADGAERKRVVAWMLESQRGYLAPLTASLHRFGFETQAWTDGEEMRRKLSAGAAPGTRTLAVLSILPDGAGLEGDLRILASAAESGIPVLCTLPFIAQSQGARLLAAGAAGILTKPFRNADIQAAIRKALPDWEGGDAADRDKEKSGPSGLGEWMEPPLVLVVDDHPVNLTVASAMLKRMGCTVETVLDGSSALLATSERPYDLVFMDCQMPVMDGYETTRKFRARESEGQHTPIIALTAHATAGVKEHCLAEGMDDYVSKPFTYGEIGLMVRKWVKPGLDWNPPSNPGEDPQTLSVGVEPQEGLSDWDRSPATGFEDSEATVDWVRLDNLSDGSAEASVMVEKLIRLFIDTTRLSLDSVEQDLREQRMEAFIKGLHRMKGGCGTIGARAMFNHLKAMESESESGDGESLRIMLVRLEAIFAETCGLLERLT